jgi:LPXTG-motif cell wall-anchored protein
MSAGLPAHAADQPSPGTATAIAGKVDLDVQLLTGLLGALHLGGPTALDLPLANLALGEAGAPNANGDSANFTNSVVRLRDDLIAQLHLPGPEADLLKADAVSGTARVIRGPGGFTQAYATVANLRLFLPLLQLPGASADNGILKVDAVSAQATCQPGQKPSVSAKLPTTIVLLGQQIPVPLSGKVEVGPLKVYLSPVSATDTAGGSAAVEARIDLDAVGLAKVSGGIVLASAACTMPSAAAAGGGTTSGSTGSSSTSRAPGTPTTALAGAATTSKGSGPLGAAATSPGSQAAAGNGDQDLAATGASGSLLPIAGIAAVLVLGGTGLLVYLKRKSAAVPPEE